MPERKPIFYDQERRRWRRTRRVLEITGGFLAIVLIIFLINVGRNPELPDILQADTHAGLHAVRAHLPLLRPKPTRGRKRKIAALGKIPQNYDPLRAAFYEEDDASSLASLQLHYHDIDLLIPDALHAAWPDGHLEIDTHTKLDAWMKSMQPTGLELPIMSMVNNYNGKDWAIKDMADMLAHPAARDRLVKELTDFVSSQHQPGLVVDFEQVPKSSMPDFNRFIHDLGESLRASNLKLMVALPAADWTYDYKYLAAQSDAIIFMNYDFHYSTSDPGPITAQDWFITNIQNILKLVPAEKIVMGIANYGYDWQAKTKTAPHPIAQPVTFQQAIVTAVESETDVEFDSDSLNPHYSYEDEKNNVHQVWMLDALTAYNELRAAERAGVRGTALWRLGMEDPSIWFIWDATHPDDVIRSKVQEVPPGYDLILEGQGDIWRITATPQSGRREYEYDSSTDLFTDETFKTYPLSWRIDQMGYAPHKIALTFDDGPDNTWTPQIVDILHQKQVPAAFFVIGESANQYPGIVKREFEFGNEVGNHTFTHPDFETISKSQLQFELNLTELLLESNLGVKTLLFRPPYGIDHQPETASEIAMLPVPQSMGYIIVGAQIDPHDWGEADGGAPPPVDTIVQRVMNDAQNGRGNIILMHDGGGDRSHTIAALPQIIDGLRAQGYEFVSVGSLLGQTRAQVMPPLSHQEWLLARADAFAFEAFRWFRFGIAFIFMTGILLVSGRALIIGLLALAEKLRPSPVDHPEYKPEVTVMIPAYNEETVIVDTVRSALASVYPRLEILVIDDGSSDRTAELVRANFGRDPRVRLLLQPNRGKPAALNHALAEATGEIVVSIDADTIVDPEAVPRLVRHFANPKVGAVAGNVKVMNRNKWLTRWQALEYITSQNLEKRAFDLLNCIPVVPGAAGAWRTDLLRANGGFSGDTVAEDTDLTLTIRRNGWKILYDEEAIGRTEVPDTVEALIRQRFRWTFGTLQAVWKHRDAVGKPRYGTLGWIAIPNIFLFQIILPLVSPVIDLLFILSIALWGLAQLRIARLPQLWTLQDVERSLIFFAIFMVIDLLTCVVAFALEKNEDWTLLAPLILQRFYYRQMMYVVLFRALKEAVQGRPVGWRGVEPQIPTPVVQS
ncbi:MAG TPA: glycosyltransferase [Candidatus Binatus sp.]|jgi:cellulose synthase/poly-beta-1,6-N-acetylglucosamine synthase-like glycosyltransferase/spore germination protein YaaH/peptidoglycan/xylan/chitin deacetylase (PgdA/CDA1 family)|nr:glycosyltransferase [Candidatus Binatus sp.]